MDSTTRNLLGKKENAEYYRNSRPALHFPPLSSYDTKISCSFSLPMNINLAHTLNCRDPKIEETKKKGMHQNIELQVENQSFFQILPFLIPFSQ